MGLSKETKYVTLTNKGYIEYTHNLVESIKENGVDLDLVVYSLDEISFEYFSKKNIQTKLINVASEDLDISNFELQNSPDFYKIVYFKFFCINDLLKSFQFVHFLDGDIVVKKDFTKNILDYSDGLDLLAQNNKSPHDNNFDEINSGFMLFQSNKKVMKHINPNRFSLKKFSKYKFHDQTYINNIKSKLNYELLNLDDFPNGAHYKEFKKEIDPFIIHYNYILGHEKKNQMISDNHWYL